MAQVYFPQNIVTTRLNTSLSSRITNGQLQRPTPVTTATNVHRAALVFQFDAQEIEIHQIIVTLAEVDILTGANFLLTNAILGQLVVLLNYKRSPNTMQFDPYYTDDLLRTFANGGRIVNTANGGNFPVDYVGTSLANVYRDSEEVLVDVKIGTLQGTPYVYNFKPPITKFQANDKITVILTPFYLANSSFWDDRTFDGTNFLTVATKWFSYLGAERVDAAIGSPLITPLERTLMVRGCVK